MGTQIPSAITIARNITEGSLLVDSVCAKFSSGHDIFCKVLSEVLNQSFITVHLIPPTQVVSHWNDAGHTVRKVTVSWKDEDGVKYPIHCTLSKRGGKFHTEQTSAT